MSRFIIKSIVAAAAFIAVGLFPSLLSYSNYYQPLIVGASLGFLGMIVEELTLKRMDVWVSTIMDFVSVGTVVFLLIPGLNGVTVSFVGAIAVALIVSIVEYFYHIHLLKEVDKPAYNKE